MHLLGICHNLQSNQALPWLTNYNYLWFKRQQNIIWQFGPIGQKNNILIPGNPISDDCFLQHENGRRLWDRGRFPVPQRKQQMNHTSTREHRGRSLVFCVYPPGQQNDRGKRWHCKEIQQLGGTQGTVPCVLHKTAHATIRSPGNRRKTGSR